MNALNDNSANLMFISRKSCFHFAQLAGDARGSNPPPSSIGRTKLRHNFAARPAPDSSALHSKRFRPD